MSSEMMTSSDILRIIRAMQHRNLIILVFCRFAQGFEDAGFEILNDVVLNQVLVSFGDDATTRAVIDAIQRDGTCWCGATIWQGRTAMRISVSSWATTDEDVEKSLRAMISIAQRLGSPSA